ncbi:gag-pol polyprotein [Tanacetum coccineum]
MPQPMKNPKDSSDPTTAMNTTLALLAKAFKVNTIPTNNNQRSSLIPRNSQITQPGMNTSQDIKMQMVDDNVGNQVRQNAVQNSSIEIVENINGLSVVSEIENQYGNGNVVTSLAEGNGNGINGNSVRCYNGNGINGNPIRCYNCRGEGHYASNCTVKSRKQDAAYLQQQLQIAQEEEAVNPSHSSGILTMLSSMTAQWIKVPKDKNCYDHDIFNMLTHEVQYTMLQTELDQCKYDKISYDKAYNDTQQKIKRLQAQLGDLKGKSSDTHCVSNTLDPVSQKLEDKNMSLEFQVSKQKGTTKAFSKSSVLPKVDKMNALSKPFTSNSAPSTRESKVVQTVNVIAPRIFRTNPSKTSRVDNVNNTAKTRRPHPRSNSKTDRVPSKSKCSCLSNNLEKIEENHRNFLIPKNQKHMSSECNNITLAIRNAKLEIVANQKKRKPKTKKSKKLGSKKNLASSRPSKPRTCLWWIPTGRIFAMCGKLTASSNTESESDTSVCDNASTSNPPELSSKGFLNYASLLGRYDSHDVDDRVGKSIQSFVRRIIQMEKIKLFQSLPNTPFGIPLRYCSIGYEHEPRHQDENGGDNVGNQYGNGNVVIAPAEGNGNGINGNPIRCYNCRGEGHYASNCTVKPRKRDAVAEIK